MNRLDEITKIADIHVNRIELAMLRLKNIFPLNEQKVLNFSDEELMLVELLISRFSKLQDYMGRILINFILKHTGDYEDSMTMIDKLNKLERLGINFLYNPTSAATCGVDFVLGSSCISNTFRSCAPKSPSILLPEADSTRSLSKNTSIWEKMQEAKNQIAHEYPDQPALTAKYLNQIFDLAPHLIEILNKMKSSCQK